MGLRPIYIGRHYPATVLCTVSIRRRQKEIDVANSAAFFVFVHSQNKASSEVKAYLYYQTLSADLQSIILEIESGIEMEKLLLAHIRISVEWG